MRNAQAILVALALSACATLQPSEPVQVTLAGIEPLPSEGLELRMVIKLRVQNPNDAPVDYDGVYVKLDVLDNTLATGVSDARGTIPRYGEAVVGVPVTVSTLRVALGALNMLTAGRPVEKVSYVLQGKLAGPAFGSTSFKMNGEMNLPFAAAPGSVLR